MNENDKKTRQYSTAGASSLDKADRRLFTGFDDNEDYEEPDRDTDYTSAYREDILEEEDFDDPLFEDEGPLEDTDWAEPLLREVPSEPDAGQVPTQENQGGASDPSHAVTAADEEDIWDQDTPAAAAPGTVSSPQADDFQAAEEDDWDDEGDYTEEEDYTEPEDVVEDEGGLLNWPLGLIAVAIIALLLLTLGGYGIIQQRAETQEQIRQLQSALATSVDPDEASATRGVLQGAEQRLTELQAVIDVLTLENRRLTDTVSGLESQLTAQQKALASQAAGELQKDAGEPEPAPKAVSKAAPKTAPKPQPEAASETRVAIVEPPAAAKATAAASTAAASSGSGWFVNFASYGVRDTADKWVARLQPAAGKAVVSTTSKNGRTYYRVRVVDLPDRAAADRVARELATKHALPKLWVGRE